MEVADWGSLAEGEHAVHKVANTAHTRYEILCFILILNYCEYNNTSKYIRIRYAAC
jgi:hypothetical protein